MKKQICNYIEKFVSEYQRGQDKIYWRKPIVGFASAKNPLFARLKEVVSEAHLLPADLLPKAETVVAFFIPFESWIVSSNINGKTASPGWASAYVETNKMIFELSNHIKNHLETQGYAAATVPPTHNFDPDTLISNWSHRHISYAAGLGTFGLNNMLITESGCCGRIGSFVTSAIVTPDKLKEKELCLYKLNFSCKKCVSRCINKSLLMDTFNRFTCYDSCLQNAKLYSSFGKADVCGKCLVSLPCSLKNPVLPKSDKCVF